MMRGIRRAVILPRQYGPEAQALFGRFAIPPTEPRKGQINTLIAALKAAGVWSKLDALYLMAAADNQAATRNWIADQFNLTEVAAPTFTADRGFAGNGSSSYLRTGFTPSAAAGKMTLNDTHLGVWSRTNSSGIAVDIGGGSGSAYLVLRSRQVELRANMHDSAATGIIAAVADSLGHSVAVRAASGTIEGFKNGSSVGSVSQSSTSLVTKELYIGASNESTVTNFSSRQYAAAHFGAALGGQQVADMRTALNTYLMAVGAA